MTLLLFIIYSTVICRAYSPDTHPYGVINCDGGNNCKLEAVQFKAQSHYRYEGHAICTFTQGKQLFSISSQNKKLTQN